MRFEPRGAEDDYGQAGDLYRLLTPARQDSLARNIAAAMRSVAIDFRDRQLAQFDRADAAYGAGVRAALAAPGR